jgi:hypothetical protein
MDIKKYREWISETKEITSEVEVLEEAKLSPYWKKRARDRAKNAGRAINNGVDRKWALEQQEKSSSIDKDIHKIFEKELSENEELSEEITAFLERIKKKREEMKALEEEKKKAKLEKTKGKRGNKTLPNPYAGEKTTKKFPYGGGKDGGVAKVYQRRMKKARGATIAPGESIPAAGIGPMMEAPVNLGSGAAPRPSQVKAAMKAFGMLPSSKSNKSSGGSSQMSLPGMARDIQKEFSSLNPTQQNNFYKLLEDVPKYDIDGISSKGTVEILSFFGIELGDVIDIVKSCPSIENTNIESPLMAGTQGLTFNLENDHVLKLFVGGYQDDLKWYSGLKNKMYGSDGSVHSLPIYDSGKTKAADKYGASVKFAEMAKLIPFGSFVEDTGRSKSKANAALTNIEYLMYQIANLDPGQALLKAKRIRKRKELAFPELTKQEFINIVKMFYFFMHSGHMINDSHTGNIGILPQSSPTNPTFVVFDN